MAFASSNRTAIRRVEETTFGTTPATPAFLDSRYTSESINFSITNITSNEIRSDRQTSDLVQTEADVSGSLDFELSYESFEDFFIHALGDGDGFSADYAISAADIDAVAGGFSSGATDFVVAGVAVGDWIRVSGFTVNTAENNGYFRVKTVAAALITVEDSSGIIAEVSAGTIDIHSSKIVNGVTERSHAMEKEFGDAFADVANQTPVFIYFNGVRTCGFTLNVNVGEILTGSFNFQGTQASTNEAEFDGQVSVTAGDYVRASGSWLTDGFAIGMEVVGLGFTNDANNCVSTVTGVTAANLTTDSVKVVEGVAARTVRSLNPPRFAGATTTAANTNQVMNAVGNVVQVNGDGKESVSCFNTLTVNYDNNCRPIDCVGTLGHVDIKFGRVEVTGTIGLFFENMLEYYKFLNGESFSFAFHVEDNPGAGQTFGNAYTFNFPFAKYETGQLVSEGLDTNIFFNADFRALIDRAYPTGTGFTSDGTNLATFGVFKYAAL